MESSSVTTSVGSVKTMDVGLDSIHSQDIVLKLRKNRRIENKWGTQYHTAVQSAVFGRQCLPYMPTEPPASLSEEILESEPLYVCKQCKDCFRFKSSFEDHNKRRSWILGLWCHNCFITVCTHITETGSACPICLKKDSEKRSYLRTRGLTKNQKLGAVKVFYNQCQFFEHVKLHGLGTVDMGDITLMPLPVDMTDSDWSSEFEIMCEALMERTLLLRMHIMNWLKMYNLENNWWKLVNGKSTNNLISKIVQGYQGRQLFKTFEKLTVDQFTDSSSYAVHNSSKSSPEFTDSSFKDKDTNNYSTNMISDKNISENEDNPCMSTDIAFVDCGPTSQCFEPESSVGYIPRRRATVVTKTAKDTTNWHVTDMLKTYNKRKNTGSKNTSLLEIDMTHGNTTTVKAKDKSSNKNFVIKPFVKTTAENSISKSIIETDVSKILEDPVQIDTPFSAKKVVLSQSNSDHFKKLQMSTVSKNSKVLNVQNSKNAEITSIISQLSPHVTNKIVLIGQDSHNLIVHNKNEMSTGKKSSKSNSNTDTNVSSQKICDSMNMKKQEVTSKIVIKNGKKYLIKHSKNVTKGPENSLLILNNATKTVKPRAQEHNISTSISTSSIEAENISTEQASLHNNISLLTPSPSSSELTSNSNCDSNVKKTSITSKLRKVPSRLIAAYSALPNQKKYLFETISLVREENGDYFMCIKIVDRISKEGFQDMCEIIPKFRVDMIKEFHQLNSFELKERIEHLQFVSEEMNNVLGFMSDTVLKEKLRSISIFQRILEECLQKYNQDVQDKKNDDVILNEWESEMSNKTDSAYKCPLCNKFMKPKSYIPGFSKLSKDDDAYCPCYKQVCHECLSYQGTLSRFVAHQNFHKKSKPYVCPDCHSKFNSAKSLEVHTWTVCFHTLKKRVFACKICEIDGFRDMESITRHFVIMHSDTRIACEDCFKVFLSYSEYMKHYTEAHPSMLKQNPTRLVICKLSNVIVRCENYMSYLEKYSGIRKVIWFKCPFCPLITLENKHMTKVLNAHLRNKHLHCMAEIISKEALIDIFGTELLKADASEISEDLVDTLVNEAPRVDTVVPKIVNTRTISSEIFERGSQNMEDFWFKYGVNFDEIIDTNPRTTEKIDDVEKIELSPKILSVRSIDDLRPLKPKRAITISSTETKEKSSSQSSEVIIEVEDGKKDPLAHEDVKDTAIELDNCKSDSKKEAEPKELDKDNEMVTLCIPESEKFLLTNIDSHVNLPVDPSKKVLDSKSVSKTNVDGRIKVVDIRKICKPSIESLVATELCDTQMNDENATYIPKPPPLARIPQHLLEPTETSEPNYGSKSIVKSKKSHARGVADKSKSRIAIHGVTKTQEGDVDYLCHLCGECINTSQSVVRTHFREKHSDEYRLAVITPRLLRMSSDFINGGYKQFLSSRKRKSDSSLYMPKRKRRWTPKKHTETKDASAPVGLCVEQETAEDGEGNFKCKKCSQCCTDMSNLRKHIAANHRLKGRYLICLECGENFVVVPSLQMHLKIFHKIEDPINYMSQNPSYAPGIDGDSETEGRTTVANQCYVCMAVFEDKAAVDKHLRVHGMAFLNRKRIEARNAQKSPEKKPNTEEDKQNIVKDNPKEAAKRDNPAETILEKLNAVM